MRTSYGINTDGRLVPGRSPPFGNMQLIRISALNNAKQVSRILRAKRSLRSSRSSVTHTLPGAARSLPWVTGMGQPAPNVPTCPRTCSRSSTIFSMRKTGQDRDPGHLFGIISMGFVKDDSCLLQWKHSQDPNLHLKIHRSRFWFFAPPGREFPHLLEEAHPPLQDCFLHPKKATREGCEAITMVYRCDSKWAILGTCWFVGHLLPSSSCSYLWPVPPWL